MYATRKIEAEDTPQYTKIFILNHALYQSEDGRCLVSKSHNQVTHNVYRNI